MESFSFTMSVLFVLNKSISLSMQSHEVLTQPELSCYYATNLHVLLYECFLIARIGTGYRHSRSRMSDVSPARYKSVCNQFNTHLLAISWKLLTLRVSRSLTNVKQPCGRFTRFFGPPLDHKVRKILIPP